MGKYFELGLGSRPIRLQCGCLLIALFQIMGCSEKQNTARAIESSGVSVMPPDSVIYQTSWNMGRDLDEPENNYDSRFSLRVRQVRSGRFDILLSADSAGQTVVVDSVGVNGITSADHFTEGCGRDKDSTKPTIGILRDSVHERRSHPRYAWAVDTLSRSITRLSVDSVVCFIAGPE
jgi:hypothetical protein